ncbi:MAG: peptidylprolyl isomerase [Salinivirgaceae bacterium]|nr:peptidylprolyl isomerase [Salinivirgaceae bacterium]
MKNIILLLLFVLPLASVAQNDILLTIDNNKNISLDEFKRIYLKNNKIDEVVTKQTVEDYLDLFVNFKLKVYEAENLNLDKRASFVAELKKYRNQLAEPYLVDKSTSDKLYEEAYERMFKAVRASHILLQVDNNASPVDTLAAYNKAMEIKKKLEGGEDFAKIAIKYSNDPSVKQNFGELGYFSAMRMVYPFESAAYTTPVGGISDPIRTQFGYHILKVWDVMPIEGSLDVQFIVTREQTVDLAKNVNSAQGKIKEAYDSIQNGMSMNDAIHRFSEDKNASGTNGLLSKYEPGRMFPEFDSMAFSMEQGTMSEPFYSELLRAWFIIYIKGKSPHPSYNEALDQIKRRVGRMPHSYLRSRNLAVKLLKEYNVVADESVVAIAIDTLKQKHENGRAYSENILENMKTPFAIINDTVPLIQHDFLMYLESTINEKPNDIVEYSKSKVQEFLEKAVLKYENEILHQKYPDFAYTVQEYHDGILLFNITDSIVWQKASADTAGLREFFNKNSQNYTWDERIDAAILTSNAVEHSNKLGKTLQKAMKKGTEINAEFIHKLRAEFNDSSIFVKVERLPQERGQNELVTKTGYKKGMHLVQETENRLLWCYVFGTVPPTPKKLSEVRGMVTADYQNELEKRWIQELRKKYNIVENKEILENLYNQ